MCSLTPNKPLRILFADDTDDVRRLVALQLQKAGFVVDVACDGTEALQLFEDAKFWKRPYDLVLLDAAMPDMDGFMVAEAIRASDDDAVHIGFFTAFEDEMTTIRAALVEACGVWVKAKDFANLSTDILRVLDSSRSDSLSENPV